MTIPFVGLHAHSVAGSIFDALGYPQEHMDFAFSNGSDALALTDHGNMNGLSYQVLHAKKMKKEGKNFKPIFGCEAYFIPSLDEWRSEFDRIKAESEQNTKAKSEIDESISGATVEDEAAAKKENKSILNRRRHLVLLAMNQKGLNNIFKLVSESYKTENFYRYPRMDYALLEKYNEGVIALSACLGGVYAGCYWENRDKGEDAILASFRETTKRMVSIFGDRWYGELQWNNVPEQHILNKYIIKMKEEFGIKLVSTADSHYPNRNAWKDRELYKRLGWLGKGRPDWAENQSELPSGVDEIGYELYPKNGQQMWESYKKYSAECEATYNDNVVMESITNTYQIAHTRIESFLPDATVRLPDFVVPAGFNADEALRHYAVEGLRGLGLINNKEYCDRLDYELDVIKNQNFSKYFLTMKAISDKALSVQLTGPGRGSAAGSLVTYSLGITQVDPIKHGLLFERFMTKNQDGFPDIDYDVSDPMALKEMLINEWGDTTVVPISNWNTLQLKSLVKDISKFYDISFKEVNEVTSKMMAEATPLAKKAHGMKAGVYVPTFEEVKEYSKSLQDFLDKYPHIATHIDVLYGQIRSCSRHAGGVVVGENLDYYMPLINSDGVRQTPWSEGQNVRHLEPMGFIKFDILGLASLRMIESAIRHILKRHHNNPNPTFADVHKFYEENLHPEKMNLSDKKVYQNIFHEGKWAGIFQFTERGAQDFCKRVKPNNIIDLSAITSIYRPGPLSANVDTQFAEAKENPSKVKYAHAVIKEVTKETYGFLIFQEQIALLAHKLGKDVTLDEGNKLRKLLTKKGTGKGFEEKDKIHSKFITGCVEKGLNEKSAQQLWETFEYFSGYGFNKSHAVCYSVLSYQCAWLATYFESEWLCAFLEKESEQDQNKDDKINRKEKAINLIKSFGFSISSLDINKSGTTWEISEDGKEFIQPLTCIKGLGEAAMEQIINNRPFKSAEELLFTESVSYSKFNKKALDVLIRAGACNSLIDSRFTGAKHFWSAVAVDRPKNKKKLLENIELYKPEGDFTDEEKIEYLTDLTGEYPVSMVLPIEVAKRFEEKYIPPIGEYDEELGITWFIVRNVINKRTANGKDYLVLEVIDDTNKLTQIRCWGVKPNEKVHKNRVYMSKINYDPSWGFSVRNITAQLKLVA
jgi:DNA polymerase-3 subunit alpha